MTPNITGGGDVPQVWVLLPLTSHAGLRFRGISTMTKTTHVRSLGAGTLGMESRTRQVWLKSTSLPVVSLEIEKYNELSNKNDAFVDESFVDFFFSGHSDCKSQLTNNSTVTPCGLFW